MTRSCTYTDPLVLNQRRPAHPTDVCRVQPARRGRGQVAQRGSLGYAGGPEVSWLCMQGSGSVRVRGTLLSLADLPPNRGESLAAKFSLCPPRPHLSCPQHWRQPAVARCRAGAAVEAARGAAQDLQVQAEGLVRCGPHLGNAWQGLPEWQCMSACRCSSPGSPSSSIHWCTNSMHSACVTATTAAHPPPCAACTPTCTCTCCSSRARRTSCCSCCRP